MNNKIVSPKRRSLLKLMGSSPVLGFSRAHAKGELQVALLVPGGDQLATSTPVTWAAGELEKALKGKGVSFRKISTPGAAKRGELVIALTAEPATPPEGFGRVKKAKSKRGFLMVTHIWKDAGADGRVKVFRVRPAHVET